MNLDTFLLILIVLFLSYNYFLDGTFFNQEHFNANDKINNKINHTESKLKPKEIKDKTSHIPPSIHRSYPQIDPRPHPLYFNPFYIYHSKNLHDNIDIIDLDMSNELNHISLLQFLVSIHEIFELKNIWYILGFDTLLKFHTFGKLNKKFNNDKIDLFIKASDLHKIIEIDNILKYFKYKLIVDKNIAIIKYQNYQINLYPIESKNGTVNFILDCNTGNCEDTSNDFNKLFGFSENFIENRKEYTIDSIKLWGPSDPNLLIEYWIQKLNNLKYIKNNNIQLD